MVGRIVRHLEGTSLTEGVSSRSRRAPLQRLNSRCLFDKVDEFRALVFFHVGPNDPWNRAAKKFTHVAAKTALCEIHSVLCRLERAGEVQNQKQDKKPLRIRDWMSIEIRGVIEYASELRFLSNLTPNLAMIFRQRKEVLNALNLRVFVNRIGAR